MDSNNEIECPVNVCSPEDGISTSLTVDDTKQIINSPSDDGANGCINTKSATPDMDPTSDNVVTEDTPSKLDQDDSIGDTVFSKAWVLSILVEIVQSVETGRATSELSCHGRNGAEEMKCSEKYCEDNSEELDEQLEGRVCTLWDASMNNVCAWEINC